MTTTSSDLHAIDALDPASGVRLAGILDAEPVGEGFRLRRLPPWTRRVLLDPAAAFVATMPSGARIELVTDSTCLEVDAMLSFFVVKPDVPRPAVFDLVVDGRPVGSQSHTEGRIIVTDPATNAIDVQRGPAVTIRFDGLAPGMKHVELWLAQGASFEWRRLRVDAGATVEPAPRPPGPRWIHHGSSISHCMEADSPLGVWPVVAARRAGADLQSFGFAGQCHLDQYVARTIRDLDADVISLKVGINVVNGDTMRERVFLPAVQGFLDTVRDGHGDTPIALITPVICPAAEDAPGPTLGGADGRVHVVERPPELALGALSLKRIRQLLGDVVAARQGAGDTNIHLIDGQDLFGPGDVADLPDGLHPNAAGYLRMGQRFHDLAFAPGGVLAG